MATELQPINGQKSFYGKALIIKDNLLGETFLKSYDTLIFHIKNEETKTLVHPCVISSTTLKHIKAFNGMNFKEYKELYAKQHAKSEEDKKEILSTKLGRY